MIPSDLEFLKAILGVLSIFGATASGVMALLVEYKDKETGKITKWGRYALFGLAISFLIGTSTAWVDYIQKSRETRDAAEKSRINTEKTLQIVTDINRTLNPFKDVRVTFFISYPFDHPDLARYRERLDQGVRALLPDIRSQEIQGVRWSVMNRDGRIEAVKINEGSALFPKRSSEYLASEVLFRRGLTLYFFRTPINPSTFDFCCEAADIKMSFEEDEEREKIEVNYNLDSKTITFQGFSILSKPQNWQSSGKIVSMLDLAGTQLIIQLEYDAAVTSFTNPPDPDLPVERINLPNSIRVWLEIADRRAWLLPTKKFQLYKGPKGTTNFVYSFPESYEEILAETK